MVLKMLELSGMRGDTWKCAKLCEGLGIELLSSGLNISAQIMSAKLE